MYFDSPTYKAEEFVEVISTRRQTGKTTALIAGALAYKATFPESPEPIIITVNHQMADMLQKKGVKAIAFDRLYTLRGTRAPIMIEPDVVNVLLIELIRENYKLFEEKKRLEERIKDFKDAVRGLGI
jgi:hypothetical protein